MGTVAELASLAWSVLWSVAKWLLITALQVVGLVGFLGLAHVESADRALIVVALLSMKVGYTVRGLLDD